MAGPLHRLLGELYRYGATIGLAWEGLTTDERLIVVLVIDAFCVALLLLIGRRMRRSRGQKPGASINRVEAVKRAGRQDDSAPAAVPPIPECSEKTWKAQSLTLVGIVLFEDTFAIGRLGDELCHKYFNRGRRKGLYEKLKSKRSKVHGIDVLYVRKPRHGRWSMIVVENKVNKSRYDFCQLSDDSIAMQCERYLKSADPGLVRTAELVKQALRGDGSYRLERWFMRHDLKKGVTEITPVGSDGRPALDEGVPRRSDCSRYLRRILEARLKSGRYGYGGVPDGGGNVDVVNHPHGVSKRGALLPTRTPSVAPPPTVAKTTEQVHATNMGAVGPGWKVIGDSCGLFRLGREVRPGTVFHLGNADGFRFSRALQGDLDGFNWVAVGLLKRLWASANELKRRTSGTIAEGEVAELVAALEDVQYRAKFIRPEAYRGKGETLDVSTVRGEYAAEELVLSRELRRIWNFAAEGKADEVIVPRGMGVVRALSGDGSQPMQVDLESKFVHGIPIYLAADSPGVMSDVKDLLVDGGLGGCRRGKPRGGFAASVRVQLVGSGSASTLVISGPKEHGVRTGGLWQRRAVSFPVVDPFGAIPIAGHVRVRFDCRGVPSVTAVGWDRQRTGVGAVMAEVGRSDGGWRNDVEHHNGVLLTQSQRFGLVDGGEMRNKSFRVVVTEAGGLAFERTSLLRPSRAEGCARDCWPGGTDGDERVFLWICAYADEMGLSFSKLAFVFGVPSGAVATRLLTMRTRKARRGDRREECEYPF